MILSFRNLTLGLSLLLVSAGCQNNNGQATAADSGTGSGPVAAPTPTPTPTPAPSYTCGSTTLSSLGSVASSVVSHQGQSVMVSGNYAYMGMSGATNTGIQVVDVSTPSSPSNVTYITTQTGAGQIDATSNDILEILVDGNFLYASTYSGGLLIVDISTPASPIITGTLNLTGETWGLGKSGNYVYVGSTAAGLYVVDVSAPASPTVVNTVAGMPLRHIQVVGTKIYGSANSKVQVIDISAPATPSLLGELAVGLYTAYESYYVGGYLYALDKGGKALLTYDVSNPASISLVNTSAAGLYDFRSIHGDGTKIYVGTGGGASGEIRAYDVSTPAAPSLDGILGLTNRSYEIFLRSGIVYSANLDGKLEVARVCSN